MRWGAIQKESRPISVCHWMSHWTPQLETTFAPRSPHSAARRHASDASAVTAATGARIASVLTLMPARSLPSRPHRRQDLPSLVQVVDGVQAPADDRVRLPVEVLDPRERRRRALSVLHVDDHDERRRRGGAEIGRHGGEGPLDLGVHARELVEEPRPRPQERRLRLEAGGDRLPPPPPAPGGATKLLRPPAGGVHEGVPHLPDRPLPPGPRPRRPPPPEP